MDISFSL